MYENTPKICVRCGTQAERTDQKFCTKCGAKLGEAMYGVEERLEAERESRAEQYAKTEKKPLGMKWYFFLVAFYLMFMAAMSVINAFTYFNGRYALVLFEDMSVDEYYAKCAPALKGVDVAYGVLLIACAIVLLIIRARLARFRKNAPALFLAYFVFRMLIEAAYYAASELLRDGGLALIDLNYILVLAALYIGFIVINAVYFRKRAMLFVN